MYVNHGSHLLGPAAERFIWANSRSPFAVCRLYPLSTLPKWMRLVSNLQPRVRVRGRAASRLGPGGFHRGVSMGRLSCRALPRFGLLVFARICRHTVRTGQIARYSAEG